MNPTELEKTVKSILESTSNQIKVENDFYSGMAEIGLKKNNNGSHTFDGLAAKQNEIHHKLKKLGYEHDTALGEYNKPVGKTFHVVKIKGKHVTQRFL